MFKIHENGDGSTSIFCNKTGKLICKIKSQQKNMGLGCRPVNVVETSPKPRSCCYNLDIKSDCIPDVECESDFEKQNTGKDICDTASWDEPKEDFSNECITPSDFARCLNLVPKEKMKNESIEQLNSSFPLRHISRTKKHLVPEDLRDVKVHDNMPIFSSVGIKMLKLNQLKNFYPDQTVDLKIKHYDSFCRFQINTASVCSNFPKLRCREKKDYPVVTQRFLRDVPTHMYAFNKRQRLEKLITFKTGLDKHSRRLLLKCNKRLAVSIKRLTPEEIDKWPHKSSKIGPISADDIKAEEPSSLSSDSIATVIKPNSPMCIDLDSPTDTEDDESSDSKDPSVEYPSRKDAVSFKGVLNSSKCSSSSLKNRYGQYSKLLYKPQDYGNCCVRVKNVLTCIQSCYGKYYVTGTNIHIPFFKEFLNTQKLLTGIAIPEVNHNSRHDHAYHRPFSQETYKKKFLNCECLINKKSSQKKIKDLLKQRNYVRNKSNNLSAKLNCKKDSNSYKSVNKTVCRTVCEKIPIVDLTDDSPPKVVKNVQKNNFSNWRFHCFGCDYNKVSMEKSAAHSLATQHLKNFHCVLDTKSFLNVNTTQSGGVFEAFPGYKGGAIG